MATLPTPSTPGFPNVYQLETADLVEAGLSGIVNTPFKQLVERDAYLKLAVEALAARLIPNVTGAALIGQIDPSTGFSMLLVISSPTNVRLNAAPSTPCALSFEDGYGADGVPLTIAKYLTSNIDISNIDLAAGANATHMVYAQINGTTVELNATYRTVYVQTIAPATTTSGELWYNPIGQQWRAANGSNWNTVIRIVPLGEVDVVGGVLNAVRNYPFGVPYYDKRTAPGSVIAYAANKTPVGGWLKCDGTAISRTRYARLFYEIGTTYGVGNGSSTFNLPDLRGEFIRGFSDGRAGVDSGRVFGSAQADELKSHFHTMKKYNRSTGSGSGFFAMDDNGTDGSENTEATGGAETRPRNVAMHYFIKF